MMASEQRDSVRAPWILLLILFTTTDFAIAAEHDIGAWTSFTTAGSLAEKPGGSRWLYTVEAQARYFDIGSGINQWLVRPALGYEFASNVKVWIGYARLRATSRAGIDSDEDRFWQQVDWAKPLNGRGRLAIRGRLEQRSASISDDLRLVLRLQAKYSHPVSDNSRTTLVVALEPFVDLNDTDWDGDSTFAQNRSFVGIGWRIGDQLAIEAGYMNQYIRADSIEDRSNHLVVMNFRLVQ